MMTRTMACEWAQRGLRVNALAPGYVETPMVRRRGGRRDAGPRAAAAAHSDGAAGQT